MADEYDQLIAQLKEMHALGREAHRRFEAAQAQHNVDAMTVANEEHQVLAAEARALITPLRAIVDAHFAPLDNPDER